MPHGGLRSNGKIVMIGIPCGPDLINSLVGNALWSWMLPSNNLNPCGRFQNPINIIDLLDFLTSPLMNFIGNETLWLAHVYQLGQ